MTNLIPIGKDDHNHVIAQDLIKLVDTRLLIQANSGGGKSWLIRLLCERVANKVQIVILDPEGEYASLREKIDIAIVGEQGEIHTDVRSAALLARKLVEHHLSAVVDLYELTLDDRRRYVRLFLESLMAVPRAYWHPLLLILDEAHLFAPERSAGESEATQAVIGLMSRGRKRGFAGVISTQRFSKLHKDAAAECNNVIIGRTWLDVDQQRAGDMLGMNKPDRQALRELKPGEFFGFGPAFKHNGVIRFCSDMVSTTHPKAGERHLVEIPSASKTIKTVVEQLGDLPKQAETEIRELNEAKQKIVLLERELRARPVQTQMKTEKVMERVEVPVIKSEQLADLRAFITMLESSQDLIGQGIRSLADVVAKGSAFSHNGNNHHAKTQIVTRHLLAVAPTKPLKVAIEPPIALQPRQQRILDALAEFEAVGLLTVSRKNVAVWCDKSSKSSSFHNDVSALHVAGLVHYPSDGDMSLTAAGRTQARATESITSLTQLHENWYRHIEPRQATILRILIDMYPDAVSRDDLASDVGKSATSSSFHNDISALSSLGVACYPKPNHVAATKLLFPEWQP